MKISKKGFTLIEVIAFFTVSMALIAGIFIGTGTAINRERYNDSVESFKSFLQEQYALTANPQSAKYGKSRCAVVTGDGSIIPESADINGVTTLGTGWENGLYTTIAENNETGPFRGRSNCLMYGRLIEFTGEESAGSNGWSSNGEVRVTPVIGLDLSSLGFEISNQDLDYKLQLANMNDLDLLREARLGREGEGEVYNLEWDAYVDSFNVAGSNATNYHIPAEGAILIVRAPFSTTIRTFIIPTNNAAGNPNLTDMFIPANDDGTAITPNPYQTEDRYFCVIPADTNFLSITTNTGQRANSRKVVRLSKNGGNASAVEILSEDSSVKCPTYTRNGSGGEWVTEIGE